MTGTRNPYQSRDGGRRGASRRGIVALILILLLPPIGLIYLWRLGVFQTRGRVLLTALAFVEMMLLFSWGLFGLISWNSLPPTDAPLYTA